MWIVEYVITVFTCLCTQDVHDRVDMQLGMSIEVTEFQVLGLKQMAR